MSIPLQNLTCQSRKTALQWTVLCSDVPGDRLRSIELLLDGGMNVNNRDDEGNKVTASLGCETHAPWMASQAESPSDPGYLQEMQKSI